MKNCTNANSYTKNLEMKTILEKATRDEVIERVKSLNENSSA